MIWAWRELTAWVAFQSTRVEFSVLSTYWLICNFNYRWIWCSLLVSIVSDTSVVHLTFMQAKCPYTKINKFFNVKKSWFIESHKDNWKEFAYIVTSCVSGELPPYLLWLECSFLLIPKYCSFRCLPHFLCVHSWRPFWVLANLDIYK